MEIGQLESGSIDAYWVSESTTLANRYITPETALTTDFAAASGAKSSGFTIYSFVIKTLFALLLSQTQTPGKGICCRKIRGNKRLKICKQTEHRNC